MLLQCIRLRSTKRYGCPKGNHERDCRLRAMVPRRSGRAQGGSSGSVICRNSEQLGPQGAKPLESSNARPSSRGPFDQMHQRERSHVLVLPDAHSDTSTVLADAVQASRLYFVSLVNAVFECYDRFKCVVDPQWYFTREN